MTALTIPRFATYWILIGSAICIWDAGFVLNRPRSMPGGDLHWFWVPYAKYITLDLLYGNMKNAFVVAQTWVNLLEIFTGLLALVLYHTNKGVNVKKANLGAFLLLVASIMTWAKTVLYFAHDHIDSVIFPENHPDMSMIDFIFLFFIPNVTWVCLPSLCIWNVSKQILNIVNGTANGSKSSKKNH